MSRTLLKKKKKENRHKVKTGFSPTKKREGVRERGRGGREVGNT